MNPTSARPPVALATMSPTPAIHTAGYPAPRRMLSSLLAGLCATGLLFFAMASLQPAGVAGNAEQIDQAWARLTTLNTPPPPPPSQTPRPRPKPPTRLTPSAASAATASRTPQPPRPTLSRTPQLTAPQSQPRIDPLLMGLTPGPASGSGPTLSIDPNATTLDAAGDGAGGLLDHADPRSLDALQALWNLPAKRAALGNANRKPQWLKRIEPTYPADALRKSQEGTVSLRLRVSPEGAVLEVVRLGATCQPTPGAEADFEAAAVAAAERSIFLPGTDSAGRVVEQWVKVSYLFQLR